LYAESNFRINEDVSANSWGVWLRADDLRPRKEGLPKVQQTALNPGKQAVADQGPVASENILEGLSPAEPFPRLATNSTKELGGARTPEGIFGMKYEGEKSRDVPIVKVSKRLARKLIQ
jgi:hypothetical protein